MREVQTVVVHVARFGLLSAVKFLYWRVERGRCLETTALLMGETCLLIGHQLVRGGRVAGAP